MKQIGKIGITHIAMAVHRKTSEKASHPYIVRRYTGKIQVYTSYPKIA